MPITVMCPDCGLTTDVQDEAAGKQFRCRECGAVVSVPGIARDEFEDDESEHSTPQSLPNNRRTTKNQPSTRGKNSTAGNVSLIVGCFVWGITLVAFIVLMVIGSTIAEDGGPPDQEQVMMLGFGGLAFCGAGVMSWMASIVGSVFGVIGISNTQSSRVTSILGLSINGLYFALASAFFLFSIIVAAAQQ